VKTTTDPTLIGIGARPIGTGKAFVGLSDDVNAVFMNPAGLAGLKTWQVQSMTTRLLNIIDYVSVAGTYNTDYGTFGLGYVGATLSGSFVTTMELEGGGGIVIPIIAGDTIDYTSSAILLSYGSEAKRFLSYNWLDKVSVGATIKIFSQGLSGGGISDGIMTGYNMDIGMLYKPMPWLSFGWNQVDLLSADLGGKLTSTSGTEHSLLSTTKLGMALKVMGDNSLYGSVQPLIYLLDLDYVPDRTTEPPTLIRTGIEWWPSNYLALRFGFDQDIIGTGASSGADVETNMCAGVGMQYEDFKFDYAYHKYGIVSENDTSYISLTYSAPAWVAPQPPKEKGYLQISSPRDKLITYNKGTVITGKVLNVKEANKLTINGAEVAFSKNGTLEATYPLLIGKNAFEIKILGNKRQILESTKIRILRLAQFKDIPDKYWAKEPIEMLATLGIMDGYADDTFQPEKTINRTELTAILVKTRKPGISESSLIAGYPGKALTAAKALTRSEGVTILSKFAELKLPELLIEGPFPDVPGRHWAAKNVAAARSAGMLTFLSNKPFEPNKEITRAEIAEMLSKTEFGTAKINKLKDFDTY